MKKRLRTNHVVLVLSLLWAAAFCAMFWAVVYIPKHGTPWDPSREEMRAEGEQVVDAIEQYKATHGYYPETMQEAGIDGRQLGSHCRYGRRLDMKGYGVDVRAGPDQWSYESISGEWLWESGVFANG